MGGLVEIGKLQLERGMNEMKEDFLREVRERSTFLGRP